MVNLEVWFFCVYLWEKVLKNSCIMVIEVDKTATALTLQKSLKHLHANRIRRKEPSMAKFFGALPNIGDGLEFQKRVRDEWR